SGMDKIVYSFRRFAGCGLSRLWQMHIFFPREDDRRLVELYRSHPGSLESDISHSGKDSLIISCLSFFPYEDTLYRSIFQFAPDVQERASEIVGSVTPDFGMHIRRTDNIKSISDSPLELFYEVTENLLSENESVKIFLATDSQTVKEDLSSRYPGTFIYNTSGASRDTRTGMIDAAAEMLILSRSRKIFGSFWSSFSEASACLGNIPLVICKTES
ncbi:MAG: hypothetical protein K2K55_09420, partial [Duncaniella sp.]|nr:hypothetical protein [Duncaniella sp.]